MVSLPFMLCPLLSRRLITTTIASTTTTTTTTLSPRTAARFLTFPSATAVLSSSFLSPYSSSSPFSTTAKHSSSSSSMADNSANPTSTPASAAPVLWEWLVIVPDKPGTRAKRLEVRPAHLQNMMALSAADTDTWKMGGVILSETPDDATNPTGWDFAGSTMVMKATSRQEIVDMLAKDIYVKEGVWDIEKIQAWPFKAAFRIQ